MTFTVPDSNELTTRQMNAFTRMTRRLKDSTAATFDGNNVPNIEVWTVSIASALMADWFGETKVNQATAVAYIEDLMPEPYEVEKLGSEVLNAYIKARQRGKIDPN